MFISNLSVSMLCFDHVYNLIFSLGAMFACSSLIEATMLMTGSIFFNNLYRATIDFWPGFSFLVMALLSLISFVFAV